MTTDLWMLVCSSVLCLLLPSVYGYGRMSLPGGWNWALGNRDTPVQQPPWAARAQRAHVNLTENLAPFAALVLVAHVSGAANWLTALGATLFFLGRVAHAVVYTAGLIGVRTAVFFVAVAGELLILIAILSSTA